MLVREGVLLLLDLKVCCVVACLQRTWRAGVLL